MSSPKKPRVGLFVTCLVDLFRPSVGFAAVKLLEDAGCRVEVPGGQTCCGQPAYNSGDRRPAKEIARQVVETFEPYDYVVAPSGSCAGMLKRHYPALLADDPLGSRATALAAKTHELISFLVRERGMTATGARYEGVVTYHDACSGLRELGIRDEPRALLRTVEGLALSEMEDAEVCCGFGGTFSVKFPATSNAILEAKTARIRAAKPDCVVAGDLGCLMNIAGKLSRQDAGIEVRHVAELLAGETSGPSLAGLQRSRDGRT